MLELSQPLQLCRVAFHLCALLLQHLVASLELLLELGRRSDLFLEGVLSNKDIALVHLHHVFKLELETAVATDCMSSRLLSPRERAPLSICESGIGLPSSGSFSSSLPFPSSTLPGPTNALPLLQR